jgi:Eukaryotic aspartyl protease
MVHQDYWAINIDGLAIDNQIVSKTQSMVALVDTGTTMVLIPEAIARDFFRNIPSAYRSQSGLFVIPCNAPNLPTFTVIINGEKYTLDGSQYVIPRFQVVRRLFFFLLGLGGPSKLLRRSKVD